MRLNRIFFLAFIFVISIQSTLAFLGKPAISQILSYGIVKCGYQQIPINKSYVITGFSKANGLQYAEIIYNTTTKKCHLGERKWTNKTFPFDLQLPENAFLVGFGYDYHKGFKSFWYSYRKINPDCTLSDIEGSSSIGQSKSFYQDRAFVEYNDGVIIGLQLGRHKKHSTKEGKFSVGYRKFTSFFQCLMEGGKWLPNAPPTDSFDEYCCYPGNKGKLSPVGQPFASDYEFLCNGSTWHKADQNSYKIYEINGSQFISDGNRWYRCDFISVSNESIGDGETLPLPHSKENPKFICYDKKFYECCFPGSCHLNNPLNNFSSQTINAGEPITLFSRETYNFIYESYPSISPYIRNDSNAAYKSIRFKVNTNKDYDLLVFFINASEIPQTSDFKVILASGTADQFSNLHILFNQNPFLYAKEVKPNKFVRIEIPLSGIDIADIDQIIFFFNVTTLPQTKTLKFQVKNIYLANTKVSLYYCTDELSNQFQYWITDPGKSKKVCSNLFTWTGTKCCYQSETYLDEEGACILGVPILENETFTLYTKACKDPVCPPFSNVPLCHAYSNKEFLSCESPDPICKMSESFLKGISKPKKVQPCTTLGNHFCSFSSGWSSEFSGTPAGQRNTSSTDPFGRTKSCCHPLFCWNGSMCLASLHDEPLQTYNISGKTYRCVYGKWITAVLKYDWFSNQSAYCPYPEQCLVDPNGNPNNFNKPETYSPDPSYAYNNPICINHSQHIFDHLCYNGEWRTRTRTLASVLLNLTTTANEFTLLCDDFKTTLPEPDLKLKYIQGESLFPAAPPTCFNFTTPVPCVNNFCVLKFIDSGKEKTLFAVSLNKPINDSEYSFLYALDLPTTYCDNIVDFDTCSNDDRIWYNPHLNAVFYSKQGITMRRGFFSRLFNIFKSIIQFITGTWKPKTMLGSLVNLSSIEIHQNYDALFIAKKDNKQILALKETRANETYIIARLENITVQLCDSFKNMPQTFCNATATEQTVLSFNPDVWNQLIKLTPT
ncbi:hypothetical protein KY307_02345 [Candidatus Woesearchaeota archaeon]|nr:hypothetical protein [Candidatus Woesearchaeota archaeon]